jgi:hypothetical protein
MTFPYLGYMVFEAQRPKSNAELHRADVQRGEQAAETTRLWRALRARRLTRRSRTLG